MNNLQSGCWLLSDPTRTDLGSILVEPVELPEYTSRSLFTCVLYTEVISISSIFCECVMERRMDFHFGCWDSSSRQNQPLSGRVTEEAGRIGTFCTTRMVQISWLSFS